MSKEELRHCPYCGAAAKVKYSAPYTWVECKKCGAATRQYPDYGEERDPEARQLAVEDWNAGEIDDGEV